MKKKKYVLCPSTSCKSKYYSPVFAITHYQNMVALNNRNAFSHCSGNQKSRLSITELKSRCQHGCGPSGVFEENRFLASSRSGGLPAFLGLWPHHSNLSLHSHMAFSYSYSNLTLLLFYKNTCHCTQSPDNPECSPHLNSECSPHPQILSCKVIGRGSREQEVDTRVRNRDFQGYR